LKVNLSLLLRQLKTMDETLAAYVEIVDKKIHPLVLPDDRVTGEYQFGKKRVR